MSKYLESCTNECKIVMLLLVVVLGYLLYQCYNKNKACAREGFVAPGCVRGKPYTFLKEIPSSHIPINYEELKNINNKYSVTNISDYKDLIKKSTCVLTPEGFLFIDSSPPVIVKSKPQSTSSTTTTTKTTTTPKKK